MALLISKVHLKFTLVFEEYLSSLEIPANEVVLPGQSQIYDLYSLPV